MKKLFKVLLVAFAVLGVLAVIAGAILFYFILKVDYKYTGEELFTAVNEHRTSIGVNTLELDPALCNNLVERWLAVREPENGHKGFDEWSESNNLNNNPKYGILGELYVVDISTPENAINFWANSPGHKSTLELPELEYGCSYANDGAGVLIVAGTGN